MPPDQKICSTEQDAVIDIKAALLQEASRLYKQKDKTASEALLKMFDLFPCLRDNNMVDKAHDPCTYPRCAAAHKIDKIKKALALKRYADIPKIIQHAERGLAHAEAQAAKHPPHV